MDYHGGPLLCEEVNCLEAKQPWPQEEEAFFEAWHRLCRVQNAVHEFRNIEPSLTLHALSVLQEKAKEFVIAVSVYGDYVKRENGQGDPSR